MDYISKLEYLKIVENSIDPINDRPEYFFYHQYKIYKDKDSHFLERLEIAVNETLDEVYKYIFDKYGKEDNWESQLFYLNYGQVIIISENDTSQLSEYQCAQLTSPFRLMQAFETFVNMTQGSRDEIIVSTEILQLNWKGQKNQLYSVIRQLKTEHNMIEETYEDLAKFLKQSFAFFIDTKLSTIEKELKKDTNLSENLSKKKRVIIDPNKE
jgi:hypothetical protein